MGAVIGLLLGTGLCLIFFALTGPPPAASSQPRRSAVQSLLARAGVEGVTTTGVAVLCLSSALVAGVLMLAISGTAPVAVMFALMAAYLLLPLDLVPDFIPVIGCLDDALLIAWALRSITRSAGAEALERHWPGTPEGLRALRLIAGLPGHGLSATEQP